MARGKNKQSLSFRFAPGTVAQLRQRAREIERATRTRGAQTQLAERYIIEGLRHDRHPMIYFRDSEGGRRAAVLGTRLNVADVITTIHQNDDSPEEGARYLDIPLEQVRAAVSYYADHKGEIDDEIREAERVARALAERWRREQEALG